MVIILNVFISMIREMESFVHCHPDSWWNRSADALECLACQFPSRKCSYGNDRGLGGSMCLSQMAHVLQTLLSCDLDITDTDCWLLSERVSGLQAFPVSEGEGEDTPVTGSTG